MRVMSYSRIASVDRLRLLAVLSCYEDAYDDNGGNAEVLRGDRFACTG